MAASQDNADRKRMSEKGNIFVSARSEHPRINTYVSCGIAQCRNRVGTNVVVWLHNNLRAHNSYRKGNGEIGTTVMSLGLRFRTPCEKRQSANN